MIKATVRAREKTKVEKHIDGTAKKRDYNLVKKLHKEAYSVSKQDNIKLTSRIAPKPYNLR